MGLLLLALLWLMIGSIVNLYYFIKRFDEFVEDLTSGELHWHNLFVGWVLTFIAWPISIANNIRKS